MYIDVHCHLDLLEKEGVSIEGVIKKCGKKKVEMLLIQGVNPGSNRRVLEIAEKFEEVMACLGMYPIDALKLSDKEIDSEIDFVRKNTDNVFAIGEIGLDLKDKEGDFERQKKIFSKFVKLAMELDVPVIVHSRKAELETIEFLEELGAKKVIMHCFSGKLNLCRRITDNGWYLSIPGNVKFSEHFQKVIEIIDVNGLLCETDSPYLHPDKEWPNDPSNVVESYKMIAKIKKMKLKGVEKQLESNFKKLFSSK